MIAEDEFTTACTLRGGPEGAGEGKEVIHQTRKTVTRHISKLKAELSNFPRCLDYSILYDFVSLSSPFLV